MKVIRKAGYQVKEDGTNDCNHGYMLLDTRLRGHKLHGFTMGDDDVPFIVEG